MFHLQKNEPVKFFDGRSSIDAVFIRKYGTDAQIKIVTSPVSVYSPGDLVTVPMDNLLPEFESGADDGSLDWND